MFPVASQPAQSDVSILVSDLVLPKVSGTLTELSALASTLLTTLSSRLCCDPRLLTIVFAGIPRSATSASFMQSSFLVVAVSSILGDFRISDGFLFLSDAPSKVFPFFFLVLFLNFLSPFSSPLISPLACFFPFNDPLE